jgi:hypothetical protein
VSLAAAVGRLIDDGREGDADARALSVAALYTVHTDQLVDVFPMVDTLLKETRDPLVRETAAWVGEQLRHSSSPPPIG